MTHAYFYELIPKTQIIQSDTITRTCGFACRHIVIVCLMLQPPPPPPYGAGRPVKIRNAPSLEKLKSVLKTDNFKLLSPINTVYLSNTLMSVYLVIILGIKVEHVLMNATNKDVLLNIHC